MLTVDSVSLHSICDLAMSLSFQLIGSDDVLPEKFRPQKEFIFPKRGFGSKGEERSFDSSVVLKILGCTMI